MMVMLLYIFWMTINLKYQIVIVRFPFYIWCLYYFRKVALNGNVLSLVNDYTLPQLLPRTQAAKDSIRIPAYSFGFFVFPDAKAPACLWEDNYCLSKPNMNIPISCDILKTSFTEFIILLYMTVIKHALLLVDNH